MLMLKILGICRVSLTINEVFRFSLGRYCLEVYDDPNASLSFHKASACEANEPSNDERRGLRYSDS